MDHTGTLIACNESLVRKELISALEAAGNFSPFYEADTLDKLQAMLDGFQQRIRIKNSGSPVHPPALTIIDASIQGRSPLDLLQAYAREPKLSNFCILAEKVEKKELIRAIQRGADGYVTKRIDHSTLIMGLRLIMAGQCFIEKEQLCQFCMDHSMQSKEAEKARLKIAGLTEREREAFMILAAGGTTKEVASTMGISRRSAENYQTALYHKLAINSPTALALIGIRSGNIPLWET